MKPLDREDATVERAAEAFDSEAPSRSLSGIPRTLATVLAIGLSVYALYWVIAIVDPQVYRVSFLLVALVLSFLLYPVVRGRRTDVSALDWLLIAMTIVALAWPVADFGRFVYRAAEPSTVDLVLGTLAIAVVLEATRRTVGWILPLSAIVFILYGYYGPLLDRVGLGLFAHRGYALDRLVGSLYMTL